MIEANESLVAILKKSHAQVMAGHTFTMDEVNLFMKNKVDELTNTVDAYSVTKPI